MFLPYGLIYSWSLYIPDDKSELNIWLNLDICFKTFVFIKIIHGSQFPLLYGSMFYKFDNLKILHFPIGDVCATYFVSAYFLNTAIYLVFSKMLLCFQSLRYCFRYQLILYICFCRHETTTSFRSTCIFNLTLYFTTPVNSNIAKF